QALTHYNETLALRRRIHNHYDETPQTLRDLSISLEKVGDIHRQRGQLDQALTHYNETLALRRRIHNHYGETPQTLRDLSISLNKVGLVREAQKQFDGALAAYTEATAIYRRLRENYDPSLSQNATWEDLLTALDRVREQLE
ncbi:tetratricopeptide repeat protein, partial [Actinophytocola sp.]|uniref:tetratricopeptide repeat protein n=1 Tax=Actinophytocola sp. TaxID=1872138 RepID=UPI00389B1C99